MLTCRSEHCIAMMMSRFNCNSCPTPRSTEKWCVSLPFHQLRNSVKVRSVQRIIRASVNWPPRADWLVYVDLTLAVTTCQYVRFKGSLNTHGRRRMSSRPTALTFRQMRPHRGHGCRTRPYFGALSAARIFSWMHATCMDSGRAKLSTRLVFGSGNHKSTTLTGFARTGRVRPNMAPDVSDPL